MLTIKVYYHHDGIIPMHVWELHNEGMELGGGGADPWGVGGGALSIDIGHRC